MKKLAVLVLFIIFGCKNTVPEESLSLLNGYWEIEEVIFPDGSVKDYGVNTSVDFIKLENKKGYRKKVQPKLDGTYNTSDDADLLVVTENKGVFTIHFTNDNSEGLVDQRFEQLVNLTDNEFTLRNIEGLTYRYKRFEPINIKK